MIIATTSSIVILLAEALVLQAHELEQLFVQHQLLVDAHGERRGTSLSSMVTSISMRPKVGGESAPSPWRPTTWGCR